LGTIYSLNLKEKASIWTRRRSELLSSPHDDLVEVPVGGIWLSICRADLAGLTKRPRSRKHHVHDSELPHCPVQTKDQVYRAKESCVGVISS